MKEASKCNVEEIFNMKAKKNQNEPHFEIIINKMKIQRLFLKKLLLYSCEFYSNHEYTLGLVSSIFGACKQFSLLVISRTPNCEF